MLKRLRTWLPVAVLLLFSLPLRADVYSFGQPRSTDNDDSCDISTLPAATLLLPYFEVDLDDVFGETTLFTVTNVSNLPQVARVTLWTDYAFPVLSFNIFLTGYDVQGINLRDVIGSGRVGGAEGTGTSVSPRGPLSRPSNINNDTRNCVRIENLDADQIARVQEAFTLGTVPGCDNTGNELENATGYATIDVVAVCTDSLPTDFPYFRTEIRYDNVLMGEYQQVSSREASAQGGPMVHIRAIPEGGNQASRPADANLRTNLPRTFYGRFINGNIPSDARQPLPAAYAARWIAGGSTNFQTYFKIWRELSSRTSGACPVMNTVDLAYVELVTFDEAENANGMVSHSRADPTPPPLPIPAAARIAITEDDMFPASPTNGAVAGWLYLNLDRVEGDNLVDQAWLISSLRAAGRFSADINSLAFGNGCSAAARSSEVHKDDGGTIVIGPAPNTTP